PRMRPQARIGFHTNMAAEALNALRLLAVPVDEVSVLTSPSALDMAPTLNAMRQARGRGTLMLTAEVGLAPAPLHRMALAPPQHWYVALMLCSSAVQVMVI